MKKRKILLIIDAILVLILLTIMIIGIMLLFRSDALKFKSEYERYNDISVKMEISKDNPIKYINEAELFDIITNKTGIIYFGYPGCPWCRNLLPKLFELAKENNIDTIYYLDPHDLKKEDNNKLKELLKDYLDEANGEKVLYVPDVYFIKNGKIMGHHLSTVSTQTDPFIPLNEEQEKELEILLQDLFDLIK